MAQDALPLRLLDIHRTLGSKGGVCFNAPAPDWNFHIISHAWTAGLSSLSQKIGLHFDKHISSPNADDTIDPGDPYLRALADANFSEDPCYHALIEFFKLLASGPDGVKWIWIDTLCINQTNKDEKSREIGNMADYYTRSEGCYVATHGIDQGYKLWKDGYEVGSDESAPRWFSRVWTLQEFLLPGKLKFIVEGLGPKTVGRMNYEIERHSRLKYGYCQCVLNYSDPTESQYSVDCVSQFQQEIISGNECCPLCEIPSLIRKAADQGHGNILYFVDKFVFFSLLLVDMHIRVPHSLGKPLSRHLSVLQALLYGERSVYHTVYEIANRDSSVEEDRVLSVLRLLGAEGSVQVRAGESLDYQIAGLVKLCDHDTLILLSAMDKRGYGAVGISWAPDNKFRSYETEEYSTVDRDKASDDVLWLFQAFQRAVQVRDVTADGKIGLTGKVSQVRIRLETPKAEDDYYLCKPSLCCGHQIVFPIKPCASVELNRRCSRNDEHLQLTIDPILPGGISVNITDAQLLSRWMEFDSLWVLLGDSQYKRNMSVVMVCISEDIGEEGGRLKLHKIGTLCLEADARALLFQECVGAVSCELGGVGEHYTVSSPCATEPNFIWTLYPNLEDD